MLAGGGNAILLLLTTMAIGGATLIGLFASRRKQPRVARTFLGGAGLLAVIYAGGLIAASAASQEKTLQPGEPKWFCGFYLDCHLGVSVEGVDTASQIGVGGRPVTADGHYYIVTLRLHNSAKNPNVNMVLYKPDARIIDATGRAYGRAPAAEAALPSTKPAPLATETTVTGKAHDATIIFDLPRNVAAPRLLMSQGWLAERAIELGLIADENSVLHRRTYLALERNTRTAGTQY